MSCDTVNAVELFKNADNDFTVRLKNLTTGDPLDLSTATAITLTLPKTDGTYLTLSLGSGLTLVGTGVLGKFQASVTKTQSTSLKEMTNGTIAGTYTIASKERRFRVLNSLTVLPETGA